MMLSLCQNHYKASVHCRQPTCTTSPPVDFYCYIHHCHVVLFSMKANTYFTISRNVEG